MFRAGCVVTTLNLYNGIYITYDNFENQMGF